MNCISPIGLDLESNWAALMRADSGIRQTDVGAISGVYVSQFADLPPVIDSSLSFLENLMLHVALPLIRGKSITARTGLVISTTKGNVEELKEGNVAKAAFGTLADTLAQKLGITSKPVVVSHACVSGLLAVSVAKRLMQMDQYDDVLVLAADTVSAFVLAGFQSFQAMSSGGCRPFDAQRDGVTLGEAAAAAWLSTNADDAKVEIVGEGAINDANHISGPSRTGEGLLRSINSALEEAGITADMVDFISAHGTATLYNDEMEAIAFDRLGLSNCLTNSLKGYYGHTLGASGLLELVVAVKSMEENTVVPTKGFEKLGTTKYLNVVQEFTAKNISYCLKTASGFGGSNAAVILKKIA